MQRAEAVKHFERIKELAQRAIADLGEADAVIAEQGVSPEESAAVSAEAAKIRAAHVGAAEERAKLIGDHAGLLVGIDSSPVTADPPPVVDVPPAPPPATDPPPAPGEPVAP